MLEAALVILFASSRFSHVVYLQLSSVCECKAAVLCESELAYHALNKEESIDY